MKADDVATANSLLADRRNLEAMLKGDGFGIVCRSPSTLFGAKSREREHAVSKAMGIVFVNAALEDIEQKLRDLGVEIEGLS